MNSLQPKAARCAALAFGVLTALWLAGCDDDGTGPEERAEEPFSFDIDASALTRLRVEGVNGGITISGTAASDSIFVQGTREVRGEGARALLDGLQVESEVVGDQAIVRTVQPQDTQGRNYTVDYEVVIPRRLAVTVTNANGGIVVESTESFVSLTNANGGIALDDINGSSFVALGNGGVAAEITLPLDGTIEINVGNGGIELRIPIGTSAEFSATVGVGTISTSNLGLQVADSTPTLLTGRLGDGRGEIELALGIGGITVTGF